MPDELKPEWLALAGRDEQIAQLQAQVAQLQAMHHPIAVEDELGDYKACAVCGAPWPWEKSISQETHLKLQAQVGTLTAQLSEMTAERDEWRRVAGVNERQNAAEIAQLQGDNTSLRRQLLQQVNVNLSQREELKNLGR